LTATDKSVYTQVAEVKGEDAGTKCSINVFEGTLTSDMLHVLPQLEVCMLEEAKLKIIEEVTKKIASKPTDSYYFNFFAVVFFLSQKDISKNATLYKILAGLCRPHRIILFPMLCHLPLNGDNEVIHADMHMEELLVSEDTGRPYRPDGGGKPSECLHVVKSKVGRRYHSEWISHSHQRMQFSLTAIRMPALQVLHGLLSFLGMTTTS